jgi:enhancing lycopene biosynthesis protein 2
MKCKVGVVLSGCGFLDGSEIHEAVLTLLALDRHGVDVVCMAPSVEQRDVVDHAASASAASTSAASARRNVLQEAARIARGRIVDLATVDAGQLDAVVLPGGFGAAKNLSDFAVRGPEATALPAVASLLRAMHARKKPIGAICIAPAVVAAAIGQAAHPTLTIGDDEATAAALRAMGCRHRAAKVDECVVDRDNRIVSTPAYMFDARIRDVQKGIDRLVDAVLQLVEEGR